ncbi:hypothetical protein ACHQM5_021664 [Ranunculus cassubicifolius]
MNSSKLFIALLILQTIFIPFPSIQSAPTNSNLFREYIGAEFNNVKFTDVPINPSVDFHFILAFAIDYTTSSSPSSTNGNFNIFWVSDNLSLSQVSSIKNYHPNIKVALSLGGDTVGGQSAYCNPSTIDSWVQNAVSSLTQIIKEYNLDGIDIDYEHFSADHDTFAECIGLINYVNFQFYAYEKGTSVSQFLTYYKTQSSNYKGGKILPSFGTDGSGGLSPEDGFFTACDKLRSQGELYGIFIWSADDSMASGFPYEKRSQAMLATNN